MTHDTKTASEKSASELLQTINPQEIADESMRRTVEILLSLIEEQQAQIKGSIPLFI